MSQTDQDTNMDKKEIAEEEREKMLNAENTKHTSAVPAADHETEEPKPKKKIPIGGIKMPGFCRTKSKEPCKVRTLLVCENNMTDTLSMSAYEFVIDLDMCCMCDIKVLSTHYKFHIKSTFFHNINYVFSFH